MKVQDLEIVENKTFDEIKIGDTAAFNKVLTKNDIEYFAVITGNANPVHLNEDYAQKNLENHKIVGHGAWVISLISNLLGNHIPGPGTVYVSQESQFHHRVEVGDTLTISITVKEKKMEGGLVIFEAKAVNQNGELVLSGTSVVKAPKNKMVGPRVKLPEISLKSNVDYFASLISKCDQLEPVVFSICHPCDQTSLQGPIDAYKAGLITPILVGPKHIIENVARENNIDISGVEIIHTENAHESALKSVELCRTGRAEVLMKGSLHTDEMMHAVVQRDTGLRSSRKISHVYAMSVPTYPRLLLITDAAVNIYPTLEDKVDIIQNAIDLAIVLGVETPKVAILSAVETVNPKIQSTIDAAALCKMADRGQIVGGILDGPLAFDNAVSIEAAKIKKIVSKVSGQADILVAPDLEAGNMIAKQLDYLAGAATAGIVLGAKVPIVLTSRAESPKARKTSAALAVLVAHNRRDRKRKELALGKI
ncbi:MAG: bifunctional enoyl-CoA hydratase/phosphate acetyltransferase [Bdellovibrionaceae bacterium]|nr:bifunctional enoyl-CoA hydratase/phosphate acetyltransferase [Pseudobdellovibrionaceae bacterium]NUM59378.1 bifunctional enoyl-CoA hydratase/phosphate acetyltransferase [Pseudobdellovibrionaceae bacterium]